MTDELYTNNAPVLQEAFEAGYTLQLIDRDGFTKYLNQTSWDSWLDSRHPNMSGKNLCLETLLKKTSLSLTPNQDLYGHHVGKVNRDWLLKHPLPAYIVSAMIICLDGSAMPQEYINEKREVMRAFNLGKTIQSRPDETCEWFDCYAPWFESHLQFRVAPNQDFKPKEK